MTELPKSAQLVSEAAANAGLDVTVMEMPASTRTAEEAAAACNCTVAQIVKSLVFRGKTSKKPYLFLVSGANRVNEKGVAKHLGEALTRPDADDVRALTGFAIGGIPPLGHATPLQTFIDTDLLGFDVVWAAAGTPKCVFSCDPNALVDAVGATPIDVKG
ncbi:YbaK/EbsC family protein [Rhodobium gokarnense]|uniref:Prolyl-tRNA editing enzyme YbaK/EbsC (Cys-tRNA(Pro) deacylase) n=1 Tax=Rhodobium gokarnense TaxID=364296 RepID=A0ABT3H5P9_9HYPH|nr:YbaK/EbsC family protein [Rhodobium gokarnense]MCW2305704.1 prolyl-tRNA editing enzyme YbaK/EbsC (Cys-tRNA(Pro) deacylase) [Rhodobium gokarnense]